MSESDYGPILRGYVACAVIGAIAARHIPEPLYTIGLTIYSVVFGYFAIRDVWMLWTTRKGAETDV